MIGRVASVVAFIMLVAMFIACGGQPDQPKANQKDNTPKPIAQPTVETTVAIIFAEFQSNEIAADAKYKDKIVQISGMVDKVGTTAFTGTPYIDLKNVGLPGSQPSAFGVVCNFPTADKNKLATVTALSRVTIVGKYKGKLGHILFEDCRLVEDQKQ